MQVKAEYCFIVLLPIQFRAPSSDRFIKQFDWWRINIDMEQRLLFPYWGKLFYVIKVRSVDKNCLHMELCQPNKNLLSWSHLVKNVTKLRQRTILSCSLIRGDKWGDKWSRNRLEVSGQKKAALKAFQATLLYFSWSHLVKNID